MAHDIFISYTEADRKLADEVSRLIKIAFKGEILPRLAVHEIKAGDIWKDEIKKHLRECRAIISIITKNSINKPWIFIEWGAYWLEGRKFYVLLADDVTLAELVHPMQDAQVTLMSNVDSVKGLFLRLSQDANYGDVPYEKANEFVVSVRSAIASQESDKLEANYGRYKNEKEELPGDDAELEKVFLYFYEKRDESNSRRVATSIKSDTIKMGIAFRLLRFNDYESAYYVARHIRSSQSQAAIVVQYIDNGFEDSSFVRNLIDDISTKSSSHLKEICFHLAEQGREDSAVFRHIVTSMSSMAELRKVATWFVDNNRFEDSVFQEIIEILSVNGAELRKIGILLVQQGHGHCAILDAIFRSLSKFHQGKIFEAVGDLDMDASIINKYGPNKAN